MGLKTVDREPILFRVAKRMARAQIRGDRFLMRLAERLGALNVVVLHKVGSITFGIPLSHAQWDRQDLEDYESSSIAALCDAISGRQHVTLFDCGADIGTFSAHMCSKSDRVKSIIAFEPNPDVTAFLSWNLSQLPVPSRFIRKAASCFEGRGRLESPPGDPADVARFLVAGDGPIEVGTIDSAGVRGGDIAIKIDVEGGELDVLKGAAETIARANSCAVTIEAHPAVVARTGRDPVECLRFLESIRPFSFVIAETGERVSTAKPVLPEGQTEVWNVVGISR